MDTFYDFTLKHGLLIVCILFSCFFFYSFSTKFIYNANRTSPNGLNSQHFFFDGLLCHPFRQRQRVCTNHLLTTAHSPVGAGDFSLSPQCQGNTRGLSHIGKHGSHI